jgi:hypothetical protein
VKEGSDALSTDRTGSRRTAPGGYAAIPTPSTLVVANGYLFFAADDGKTGAEPWALPLSP